MTALDPAFAAARRISSRPAWHEELSASGAVPMSWTKPSWLSRNSPSRGVASGVGEFAVMRSVIGAPQAAS